MIKANDKTTQQFLSHAIITNKIGEIKNHQIVKFTRGRDAGLLAMKGGVVIEMLKFTDSEFETFCRENEGKAEKILETSKDYFMFCM